MARDLHGENLIAAKRSAVNTPSFRGHDPETGQDLEPAYVEAHPEEIDAACRAAAEAFGFSSRIGPDKRARLLELVADAIDAIEEPLVERVGLETGLPEGRGRGELGRTTRQLRMFAGLVGEGSWVDARIDRSLPNRKPVPKPDLRRMLIPIGPVAVFGASNFPLAFSVAGGDTASALAAGCPVIVKGHPAHPGTSELVAEAINEAVAAASFPAGMFSLVHGVDPEVSLALVRHEAVKAVGFTGSLRAGRALFDAAADRPEPIPVYAEMGSVNPVFVLPGALRSRGDEIAEGLAGSVTLGAGQFCTNPGVVAGLAGDDFESFTRSAGDKIASSPACTLLHSGIRQGYERGVGDLEHADGVTVVSRAQVDGSSATPAAAVVFATQADEFVRQNRLREEVFGPSTLLVTCDTASQMEAVAETLDGNLTATIHGTPEDLQEYSNLVRLLQQKVGRIIFNAFPTGVEVCPSMHHGGPYPATTDVRSTSVGTAAILRFARPICFQDFPQEALPPELRDRNERGIWRLIDDEWTKEDA